MTTYKLQYQLSGTVAEYTNRRQAARALNAALRAAKDGGDMQGIGIVDDLGNRYQHPYNSITGAHNTDALEIVQM